MVSKVFLVFLWLVFVPSSLSNDDYQPDFSFDEDDERWSFHQHRREETDPHCLNIQPSRRDIVRRLCAILPYFYKERSNAAFLRELREVLRSMSEGPNVLDQEASYYATVLIPILFLHQYRDNWCLLERFYRAIRQFQDSHPTEKRSAMKVFENLRAINMQVHNFISELNQEAESPTRSTFSDFEYNVVSDNKAKYLSELIKNLG